MARINSNSLSGIVTARAAEPVQPRSLPPVSTQPVSKAPAPASSPLLNTLRGISSFGPAVGIIPGPVGGNVGPEIRNRLNNVLGRVPGYQAQADQIALPLTPHEQQMLMHAAPEVRPQLQAQIQQRHQALAQQLRGDASAVNRPFSPVETSSQMGQATQALKDNVNKTFDAYLRQLGTIPMPIHQQYQMQQAIEARRATALQEVSNNTALMGRTGASFQDVMGGKQRIEQSLDMLTRDLNHQILSRLPPEQQGMARAEIEMQRMDQAQAVHNHFSRALQPASGTDFNQLPGGAPPMTGPLTQPQARSTLARLESGIHQQYQARMQEANKLPPEMRAQATFDAQVQRDRMLVSAYRNVLGRVSQPPVMPYPNFTR
ncbi:hypothetical protein [Hyalangium sp.]|uniref:hypothetical protein n=1 Tax=Hyalangium sp. TaxID=2028555 RepID=UPI002D67A591|nr:hypothetical protein [Hyalangium sp.]HYI03196.1 hypothetical protein [Hyalangium sp.]